MATIAITGVGGLLGRALVARLNVDEPGAAHGVDRIVGLDVRPPSDLAPELTLAPELVLHAIDVRDPGLVDLLAGGDTSFACLPTQKRIYLQSAGVLSQPAMRLWK